MKIDLNRTRLEKDFESFMRALPALEPNEFCGLCKILCVETYKTENDFRIEQLEILRADKKFSEMNSKEQAELLGKIDKRAEQLAKNLSPRPIEEVLDNLMDSFLKLDKRKRKQILNLLKDYKRGV